jgi:hypothetical protein
MGSDAVLGLVVSKQELQDKEVQERVERICVSQVSGEWEKQEESDCVVGFDG